MMNLDEIRTEIDKVDKELLGCFIKRMNLSAQVAEYKQAHGLSIHNVKREREILENVSEASPEEFEGYARMFYSNLFELSRSYQGTLMNGYSKLPEIISDALENTPKVFPRRATVACQGVDGAYSQQAADKAFSFANIKYYNEFEDVFDAVESGECQYGVLPIENSTHGSVNSVYDQMHKHDFYIVKSVKLHIGHNLLGIQGAQLSDIKEIMSHEQAIGQSSTFLKKHPEIKVTVCENTAVAAKAVADSKRKDLAAISSPECAKLYGLETLKSRINDTDNNYTRFIVISRKPEIYPGAGKISIMFSTPHEPGALLRIMSRFSCLDVNLTKLESRPMVGTDFEYVFYIDMDASLYSENVIKLLGELDRELDYFSFLGGYFEV